MIDEIRQVEVRPELEIDAAEVPYRELNTRLRNGVLNGMRKMVIRNVCGQRYIGANLGNPVEIEIHGTAGNDLGGYMDGARIVVHGDVLDGCGTTMSDGEITVHGRAGDMVGMSARGGRILIRDDAGLRAGAHMGESKDRKPVVIIGGTARDLPGCGMTGGALVLLGLTLRPGEHHAARSIGAGMRGGVIYVRGTIGDHQLGKEVTKVEVDGMDLAELRGWVTEFAAHFACDATEILGGRFAKLSPVHVAAESARRVG